MFYIIMCASVLALGIGLLGLFGASMSDAPVEADEDGNVCAKVCGVSILVMVIAGICRYKGLL